MTRKRIIDEIFDQKSKLSKLFNKERVDKNVNLMIKQKSFDSKDRRIQIQTFLHYFKVNYLLFSFSTIELKFKAESKFKRCKIHFFIFSILSLIIKEFDSI